MAQLIADTRSALADLLAERGKRERTIGNNTTARNVVPGDDIIVVALHGRDIAELYRGPKAEGIRFTEACWPTVTTRDRLNTLLRPVGARIHQRDWQQYVTLADGSTHAIVPCDWYDLRGRQFVNHSTGEVLAGS